MPRFTRAEAQAMSIAPGNILGNNIFSRAVGRLALDVFDIEARLTALEGRVGAGVVPGVGGGAPGAPGPVGGGGAPRSRRNRKNRSTRKNNRRI